MTMKKKILTTLSVVLILGLAALGILAYLMDEDSDVNVMTLGNVKIEQHEYERVVENGAYKTDAAYGYVLQDFTQGKPLLPIVGDPSEPGNSPAYAGWDDTSVRMTQVDSYGSMQVFAGKNAQDKFVTVENTGKSDAYVRTLVAIEVGEADPALIGTSYHNTWTKNAVGTVNIDGINYYVIEYVYAGGKLSDGSWRHEKGVLPAGDTSYPNLSQVYLKSTATNEDMEAIDGNGNGTLDILVLSQAVQAEGFADAKTALDTAFGKASEKAAAWFAGMGNVEYIEVEGEKVQIDGEAAAEILRTLESGKDLIVDENTDIIAFDTNAVDAKGATVTLDGQGPEAYGYLAFLPDAGKNVTVSNLNVTGSGFVEVGHYGQGGGNYTLDNVKIENLAATLANGDKGFTLGCAFAHYGNAVLNNCVMTGATAIQSGAMPVDAGFVNDTTTTVNGGKYGTIYCWSHANVTIDDAYVDTLYVAPIKGEVTIKAGTEIDTLKVAYGTSAASDTRLAKLVVEDGANIGKIVFSDKNNTEKVFNTVAEWNAYIATF